VACARPLFSDPAIARVLFNDLVSILKNFADGSKKLEVKF
jgi:hypothetical protein